MRTFVFLLAYLGVMAVVVGFVLQSRQCPPPEIEYRYIPRSFQEDQDNPQRVSAIYDAMFKEPTPWIRDVSTTPRFSDLNRYYASQA